MNSFAVPPHSNSDFISSFEYGPLFSQVEKVLDEEEVHDLLKLFADRLSIQGTSSLDYMNKPSAGATGFTYLCSALVQQKAGRTIQKSRVLSLTSYRNKEEVACIHQIVHRPFSTHTADFFSSHKPLSSHRFVLKWVTNNDAINEKMGADFLRHYGFCTPHFTFISSDVAKKLAPFAQKINKGFSYISKNQTLLFMNELPGMTFKAAIEDYSLFSLSSSDWEKLGVRLGEIAIFDMLMGNEDRLIQWEIHSEHFNLIRPNPNLGNLMLQMPYNKEGQRYLESVDFIDNGFSKFLKDRPTQDSTFELDFNTLFEEGEGNFKEKEVDFDPVASNLQATLKEGNKLIELTKFFSYSIQNLDKIRDHIHEGILSKINGLVGVSQLDKKKEKFACILKEHLEEGFKNALNLLRLKDSDRLLAALVKDWADFQGQNKNLDQSTT